MEWNLRMTAAAAVALVATASVVGCSSRSLQQASNEHCRTAACYLGSISEAQWSMAAAKPTTVVFDKVDNSGAASDYAYLSKDWADPANKTLVFEAGKPYVLKFINRFSALNNTAGGDGEHYFTSPEFYSSIVVHKIVTPSATYRAPLLNDFELNAPAHNSNRDTEAEIYFVPVKSGVYTVLCKEGKHSDKSKGSGMFATLQIKGSAQRELNFEWPSDYPAALGDPKHPLKGISYASSSKQSDFWHQVELKSGEGGVAMSPLALRGNSAQAGFMGSVVRFTKAQGSAQPVTLKTEFFKTMALRKIHDKHAQIKPYMLTSIEFAAGASEANPVNATKPGTGEVDLFMVPTVQGNFDFRFDSAGRPAATAVALVR